MAETKPKAKPKNTSGRVSFPQRVYNVLKLTEENHQEHILSWVNNGTALKVHDVPEFERDLLPKYFNTQKYSSFTRTLCAYGFDCVRTGRQTGIYSHPRFNRNDTSGLSLIKRGKKIKSTPKRQDGSKTNNSSSSGAASDHLPDLKYGIRDGNQTIMFPSLLGYPSGTSNQGDDASAFGQLYQTIRSKVTDQTTKLLVRLPPGGELVSPFDSENDSVDLPSSPSPISQPLSASKSQSFHLATATKSNTNSINQKQISQNYGAVIDDSVAPIPQSPRVDLASEQQHKPYRIPHNKFDTNDGLLQDEECDDDFEPIPWSPLHSPLHESIMVPDRSSSDEVLSPSLEPRSIQEIKESPDDLNVWYNLLPVFPQPRHQALYDFSSPIALPGLFYYMDISTFGIYWAVFLIIGHTIQALLTDYGPNTRNLVLIPKIKLLKHLFMDIMWVHSLFTAMILVPEYFGTSSVMLAAGFLSSNPPSLGTSLKSHYHFHCQKVVPFAYGEWWVADIIRWLFFGYAISLLGICLGHFFGIGNLKVIGVFLMNLTPLFACQSYRLLLSIPTPGQEHQHTDKKRN